MKNCLMVIDVQNAFKTKETENVFRRIEKFIQENNRKYDHIIYAYYSNSEGSNFVRLLDWKGAMNKNKDDIAVPIIMDNGVVIKKATYTAVTDNSLNYMIQNQIKEVHICGVNTDGCVMATAYSLFDNNFKLKVISDLCFTNGGKKMHEMALAILRRNMGDKNVIKSKDIKI